MGVVYVFLRCAFLTAALVQATDVTVKTTLGTFVGYSEDVEIGGRNVTLSKFLGIPYAEPPVGDLRFAKSVMKRPLEEPMIVQNFGSPCLQFYAMMPLHGERGSEDCLFLNIFKPETRDIAEKLPVMIWLYGGGFVVGSADQYIPDNLAANGPVIIVTFNYRMSLWGFLSTEDSNSPGNYGLWDQHLAISWVHNNIEAFGGDPTRVTIFGQSAGSASAIFQGMFPGNVGLFQRIISQSGTAAAFWAVKKNPRLDAEKLARLVDCGTENVKDMMDCLRGVSVEKLNATLNEISNWEFESPMAFVPSQDGEFVSALPSETLDIKRSDGQALREVFSSFDLMIGLTSGEGGGAVHPLTGADTDAENFLPNKTFFADTLVAFITDSLYGKDTPSIIRDIVATEYTDWVDPENPINIRQQFCMMHSDTWVLSGVHRTIKAHASVSKGRSYYFLYDILPYKSLMPRPSWFNRPLHGDELLLLFNKIDMEIPGMIEIRDLLPWEKTASDNVMTLWTNFAKTGDPNKPRDIGVDWMPYTPSRRRYLELSNDVTASKVRERLEERRAELWDTLLPSIAASVKCKSQESPSSQGTCSRDGECPP